MLRLDLLHPHISGNKWFKLNYNLQKARDLNKGTILTFGGAFSNHIAATAYACKAGGFRSIGIIRGEESSQANATLSKAKELGMELVFVSREAYKLKEGEAYLHTLTSRFPDAWIVPEGGDNELGQKGCEEILTGASNLFTHIFCAYGTGTTFKGISKSLNPLQTLTGIHVLKYEATTDLPQSQILNDYHFGGYAKHTAVLLEFKSWFEERFLIELDYVYTAKLVYAVFDLMKQGKLEKEDKILIIHSGGTQGNTGYEQRYNLKPKRQVNDPQG
jgi:1-aminocyclopropane-1-carboxylate deaminase/D-cysteine desulfhydrase